MNKIAVLSLLLLLVLALCFVPSNSETSYLRIHIRADSNNESDQQIKFAVKSAVVEYLTLIIAEVTDKNEAIEAVESHLNDICAVCDKVLEQNNFSYRATAKVCKESFPTRSYNGTTLESGIYDALIINLGSGNGNNWWCVVYPPLCFVGAESTGTNSIVFKSKLLEMIERWQSENK